VATKKYPDSIYRRVRASLPNSSIEQLTDDEIDKMDPHDVFEICLINEGINQFQTVRFLVESVYKLKFDMYGNIIQVKG